LRGFDDSGVSRPEACVNPATLPEPPHCAATVRFDSFVERGFVSLAMRPEAARRKWRLCVRHWCG
jgi:hypothetical protein